jgi:putative transcription factor
MQCELCGRECPTCHEAPVDGVPMMLCPQCARHSEGSIPPKTSAPIKSYIKIRSKRKQPKDIYKNMEKELITNYNDVITEARKKKGLSREDLGFKIGERTVTIAKIENGDLRPSDKTIAKLEKELDITLLEEVKNIKPGQTTKGNGLTLGDFIKIND